MSNNRQLAKNAIFNILQFIINFGISFFFTPYLIRTVGKEAYSFFPLVNNMIGYTSIITTAVGGMAGRFVTMRIYKEDFEGAACYFNSVLVANWVLSLAFTLLAVVCVIYLPHLITIPLELEGAVRWLFVFGFLSMILGLATGLMSLGTFVKNRIDLSASRGVVTNLVRVGLILLLFAAFEPSIIYMSMSAFGAALLGVYYNFKFKRELLPEIPIQPRKYFRSAYLKKLIGSSIWNSVNQLSFLLLTQLDLLITNIFIGVAATADYSIAKMIPSLIQSFLVVLVGVFVPQFTILYAKDQHSELLYEIKKSIKMMGIAVSLPIGFLMIYGNEFFNLWIPGQVSDDLKVLSILTLIPVVISGTVNTLFHVYTVTNKLKVPSIVLLINGLLNVALTIILIKTTDMGVFAIPIASMCTLLIKHVTFTPMYAANCLKKPLFIFHKYIILGCSSCVMTIVISLICKYYIPSNTWIMFIINGIVVTVLSLIFSFFLYLSKIERQYISEQLRKRFTLGNI